MRIAEPLRRSILSSARIDQGDGGAEQCSREGFGVSCEGRTAAGGDNVRKAFAVGRRPEVLGMDAHNLSASLIARADLQRTRGSKTAK